MSEKTHSVPSATRRGERLKGLLLLGGISFFIIFLYLLNPTENPFFSCFIYKHTGFFCPSCGITRAVHLLLHGHPLAALRMNTPVTILLFPLGYIVLADAVRRITGFQLPSIVPHPKVVAVIGAILILYGILRNVPAFSFLAPTAIL